jgi:hypothetical protein
MCFTSKTARLKKINFVNNGETCASFKKYKLNNTEIV